MHQNASLRRKKSFSEEGLSHRPANASRRSICSSQLINFTSILTAVYAKELDYFYMHNAIYSFRGARNLIDAKSCGRLAHAANSVAELVACVLISGTNQRTCRQVSWLSRVGSCALLIQLGTHLKEHRREVGGCGGCGGGWAGGSIYSVDGRRRHCPVLIGAARWRRHCLYGAAAVALIRLKTTQ